MWKLLSGQGLLRLLLNLRLQIFKSLLCVVLEKGKDAFQVDLGKELIVFAIFESQELILTVV